MKKNIAVITGAGSGLGKELAKVLYEKSYFVVLVGRKNIKLENVSKDFNNNYLNIATDVSIKNNVDDIFTKVSELDGNLNIVINCAGEGVFAKVGSFNNNDLDRAFSANLIGTILMSQEALNNFDNEGTIVNVMSTAANVGRAGESIYCAAKWGAKGFTESLKLETKGSNIKVFSVYPGGMQTPFWCEKAGMVPDTTTFMKPEEVATLIVENILNKNTLQVTDIIINRR